MNATINHKADSAQVAIAEQLDIIRTLLQLLDPASPFQPILVGSIDLVAWQAFLGQAVETIESLLPKAVSRLPRRSRQSILAAASPLFSLAHSVCDAPQVHLSKHAAELAAHGFLPDFIGLEPDLFRSAEEERAVEEALAESERFLERSAQQFALLRKQLTASTKNLVNAVKRKHGLLWLLRQSLKKSKRLDEKFRNVTNKLERNVLSPPPPAELPWSQARRWYAQLATTFEEHVIPDIDAILKDTSPRLARVGSQRKPSHSPSRQSIKNVSIRSWTAFLQTYTAACNMTAAQHAYPLWRLFSGLIGTFSSRLSEEGLLKASCANGSGETRLAERFARLDERIVARALLSKWNHMLVTEDDYTLQIVLAGIHHLERLGDAEDGTGKGCPVIYGFSEETMARWLSRGEYAGVNLGREASGTFKAETRRSRRTLEFLRLYQAAFHGRQHWSPLPDKIPKSAADRLWTVNPLLAAHPQIRSLLARTPDKPVDAHLTRETRRRPSRRNRRLRRKT